MFDGFSLETDYIKAVSQILADIQLTIDETNKRFEQDLDFPKNFQSITLEPCTGNFYEPIICIKQGEHILGRITYHKQHDIIRFRVMVAGKSLMSRGMRLDRPNAVEVIEKEIFMLLEYFFPGYGIIS